MGIYREVDTEVTCDTCGERIKAWSSAGIGVSRTNRTVQKMYSLRRLRLGRRKSKV